MVAEGKKTVDIWEVFSVTRDVDMRNEIIMHYKYLVKLVVCRLIANYRNHVDFDDFISYGILGLMDAVEKYNYTKGVKFETYASIRIRGAIIDNIRKQDWISSSLRHKIKKIDEAFEQLEVKFGRPATEPEVAEYMNISLKELQGLLVDSYTANIIYFDELLSSSSNSESLLNTKDMPEENYEKKELKEILIQNINMLSKKEKMVITLYYFEELNLKEIGLILGVTESRISQVHSKALIKLRNAISKAL